LYAVLARRDNYDLTDIEHFRGKYFDVVLQGRRYTAVVLFSSFEFYVKRYHLADIQPTLCICKVHDTVLPIACLHLQASNFAAPYELPEQIAHVGDKRKGKIGSRVLLGQYLLGVHSAVDLVEDLPDSTRKRYAARARTLQKRVVGKPVGNKPKRPKRL
jgi:hypothetical protein